jgi:flagella basal body P-ring formation protein FlgA
MEVGEMNNGRPLTSRKKVQLLVALTILAWATQTLFAQWSRAADVGVSQGFVPRQGLPAGATLEMRGEARVRGTDVTLKQACRWSDADAATFAPLADVVLAKFDGRRASKVISVRDVRKTLEEAGINVALIRFSGPLECTALRTDAQTGKKESVDQWVKSTNAAERETPKEPGKSIYSADEMPESTLRGALVADLAVRLKVPADQLVLSFDPRDEAALSLAEPNFKFNLEPRRVRDLGEVSWNVTIVSEGGSKKLPINAIARAWQEQIIVSNSLSRRQLIQADDVTSRRTMVDRLSESTLLTADQVVGQMASRDLKPGVVVTAPLVEAVPLAKVGQFISVTLNRGSVQIKSVAKAMEGGCYGQTIRVKNEATKDIYQVVLTGPQEASMAPPPEIEDKAVALAKE